MVECTVTRYRLQFVGESLCASLSYRFLKKKEILERDEESQHHNSSIDRAFKMLKPETKLRCRYTVKEGYLEVSAQLVPEPFVTEEQNMLIWAAIMEELLTEEYYMFSLRVPPLFYYDIFDIDYLIGPFMDGDVEVHLPYIQVVINSKERT